MGISNGGSVGPSRQQVELPKDANLLDQVLHKEGVSHFCGVGADSDYSLYKAEHVAGRVAMVMEHADFLRAVQGRRLGDEMIFSYLVEAKEAGLTPEILEGYPGRFSFDDILSYFWWDHESGLAPLLPEHVSDFAECFNVVAVADFARRGVSEDFANAAAASFKDLHAHDVVQLAKTLEEMGDAEGNLLISRRFAEDFTLPQLIFVLQSGNMVARRGSPEMAEFFDRVLREGFTVFVDMVAKGFLEASTLDYSKGLALVADGDLSALSAAKLAEAVESAKEDLQRIAMRSWAGFLNRQEAVATFTVERYVREFWLSYRASDWQEPLQSLYRGYEGIENADQLEDAKVPVFLANDLVKKFGEGGAYDVICILQALESKYALPLPEEVSDDFTLSQLKQVLELGATLVEEGDGDLVTFFTGTLEKGFTWFSQQFADVMRMDERPKVNPTRQLRVLMQGEALDDPARLKKPSVPSLADVGSYMLRLYGSSRPEGAWKRALPADMPFKDLDVGIALSDVIGNFRNDWSEEAVAKLNAFAECARAVRGTYPDRLYAIPPEVLTEQFAFCNVHGKYDVDVAFKLWRLVNDFPEQFLARSSTRSHGHDCGEMMRDHAYYLAEFVKERFGRGLNSKSMLFLRLPIEAFSDIKGLKGLDDGYSDDEPKGLKAFYDELFGIEGMEPTMSPGYLGALIVDIVDVLKSAGLDGANSKNFLYVLRRVMEEDRAFAATLREADLSKYPDYGRDYRGYSSVDFALKLFVDAGTDDLDDYFAAIPELGGWSQGFILEYISELGIHLDVTALEKLVMCTKALGRLPESKVFAMVLSSGVDIAEVLPVKKRFRRGSVDASGLEHKLMQAAVAQNVANLRANI